MDPECQIAARRNRFKVLARCRTSELETRWDKLGLNPVYKTLRGPETGLVTLRGRIGGTGALFNFGEATVTRASVKLDDGSVGHAMALGRDAAKARISAIVDALCSDPEKAALIDAEIIAPMKAELDEADEFRRQQTAATRVDFFTMVRGED